MTPEPNLHKEVVSGVVQVIKYISEQRNNGVRSFNLGDLARAGYKGRTEEAHTHIFEFVKDGLMGLRQEHIDEIVSGDYTTIWSSTNRYLARFGYKPVEPEPVDV